MKTAEIAEGLAAPKVTQRAAAQCAVRSAFSRPSA